MAPSPRLDVYKRQRYDSARSMHSALLAWLNPESDLAPESAGSHATLEFLLRRMRHKLSLIHI